MSKSWDGISDGIWDSFGESTWDNLGISNSKTKLAQVFAVDQSFIPTKVSVYLKPFISSHASFFYASSSPVIDSTNFSGIEKTSNFILFEDTESGFTGKGYLRNKVVNSSQAPALISYPIKTSTTGIYDIWFRGQKRYRDVGSFNLKVLLDGAKVAEIDNSAVPSGFWAWYGTSIALSDTQGHSLSLQMMQDGMTLDKIVILPHGSDSPTGEGPYLTGTPYLTLISQLYSLNEDMTPKDAFAILDYKTTLGEVLVDDWYNFSLVPLTGSIDFSSMDKFAVTLTAVGSDSRNYIIWDKAPVDPYSFLPSAFLD